MLQFPLNVHKVLLIWDDLRQHPGSPQINMWQDKYSTMYLTCVKQQRVAIPLECYLEYVQNHMLLLWKAGLLAPLKANQISNKLTKLSSAIDSIITWPTISQSLSEVNVTNELLETPQNNFKPPGENMLKTNSAHIQVFKWSLWQHGKRMQDKAPRYTLNCIYIYEHTNANDHMEVRQHSKLNSQQYIICKHAEAKNANNSFKSEQQQHSSEA